MDELALNRPRHVIPRWRDFATTAALGELDVATTNQRQAFPMKADIADAKEKWAAFKSPLTAGDLFAAALAEKDWAALVETAKYLIEEDTHCPSFVKDVANQALEWADAEIVFPVVGPQSGNVAIFNPRTIGVVRRTLSRFPESPIHWVELALGYSVIGKTEKARRAILTALHLAPDDRFVLRSATRLFLHQGSPDTAKRILSTSPRTRRDAWLLAAHVAVAGVMGESPRLFKQARGVFSAAGEPPFQLSELGAALGTLELEAGNRRKAKRFFREALVTPTENAAAQAIWARADINLEGEERLLTPSHSFESSARVLVDLERWEEGLSAAENWQRDEPFSARPAILGSFLASLAQEDFKRAIVIAQAGLLASPDDATLANNLAFALACESRIQDAERVLHQAAKNGLEPAEKVAFLATEGLILYRLGRTDEGAAKYREAMALATSAKLPDMLARAALHFAREKLRADESDAASAIETALTLVAARSTSGLRLVLSKLLEDLNKRSAAT